MSLGRIEALLEEIRSLVEAPVVSGAVHKTAKDAMRLTVQLVDDEIAKRLSADAFAKSVTRQMNKKLELGLTPSDVKAVFEDSEEAMVARRRLALVVGRELLPESPEMAEQDTLVADDDTRL